MVLVVEDQIRDDGQECLDEDELDLVPEPLRIDAAGLQLVEDGAEQPLVPAFPVLPIGKVLASGSKV